MEARMVVYSRKSVYDDIDVTIHYVRDHQKAQNDEKNLKSKKSPVIKLCNQRYNAYETAAYVNLLKSYILYRRLALESLSRFHSSNTIEQIRPPVILLKLRMPEKQFLDYKWSEKVAMLALEQREIDYAMSWLSTLGGAFSAMGEEFSHCAETAGKISVHQFKLAMRLGNPLLVARCKLYACLSLIQQGNLKTPREIIPRIFNFAIEQKDKHLKKMCQGIWAKLKYSYSLRKSR